MHRRRQSLVGSIFAFLLWILIPSSSYGAHSRRRIVISRERDVYDRVITDFSPDGRLLQVEYGMEATKRGSLIAVRWTTAGICAVIHNSSFGKMHRIDHHIWLMTVGLSGDARVLANQLRKSCQQHRLNYGELPTTEEVAKMAGNFQHYLTRTGGIRPLGCSAVIMGIDPILDDNQEQLGIPKVFISDPGGIVEPCTSYSVIGRASDAVSKDLASSLLLSSNEVTNLEQIGSIMAESILQKGEIPKMVDIWTIQPKKQNRGGMQARCYRGIKTKDDISAVMGASIPKESLGENKK